MPVMTLIGKFSQTMWAYFLQDDGEALSCFVAGKTKVEKQTGERVTRLRGNNGMERGYGAFVCSTMSIVFHRTDALKMMTDKLYSMVSGSNIVKWYG